MTFPILEIGKNWKGHFELKFTVSPTLSFSLTKMPDHTYLFSYVLFSNKIYLLPRK